MAFNVVFLSLFAMLPAPMVYGAIIDGTCVLWQRECGETTNCLLYDTVKLRRTLMLTTAFIMLVGVVFDIGVWCVREMLQILNIFNADNGCKTYSRYHSKDLVIFNPEQKKNKEEAKRREELMAMAADGEGGGGGGGDFDDDSDELRAGELERAGEKFATSVSLSRDGLFKNGIALGSS